MRRHSGESGYALIVCMWLLVLTGSVAALLMVRTLAKAGEVGADLKTVQAELAAEAALETVRADLLINGDRSRFAGLPASGAVAVGDLQVDLRLVPERDRPNLAAMSAGDLAVELREAGLSGKEIAVIASRLSQVRHIGPLSADQMDGLARGLGSGDCLADRIDGRDQGGHISQDGLPGKIMTGTRLLISARSGAIVLAGRLVHGPPQTAGFSEVDKFLVTICL